MRNLGIQEVWWWGWLYKLVSYGPIVGKDFVYLICGMACFSTEDIFVSKELVENLHFFVVVKDKELLVEFFN